MIMKTVGSDIDEMRLGIACNYCRVSPGNSAFYKLIRKNYHEFHFESFQSMHKGSILQ